MQYTDASGISHTFEKYKVFNGVEYYHDTSGMYLKAEVTTEKNTIVDACGNETVFVNDRIEQSVSGII